MSDVTVENLTERMEEVIEYLRNGDLPIHGSGEAYRSTYKYGACYAAELFDNMLYDLKLKGRFKK